MNTFLRELVRSRARARCEYCRLPQHALPFIPFHIEHIVASQHGGGDEAENLALACDRCNHFKGPNLSAIDPLTKLIVILFNPRWQRWSDHFRQVGFEIVGLTETGRATVELLQMNTPRRVEFRQRLGIQLDTD